MNEEVDVSTLSKSAKRRYEFNKIAMLNSFTFVGRIKKIIQPKMIYTRGKSRIMRIVAIQEVKKKNSIQSAIAVQLPDTFALEPIESMMRQKTIVQCRFYSKVVNRGDTCFSILNCTEISPLIPDRNRMGKVQVLNMKRKVYQHRVDKDGYAFPYNY